MKFYHRFVYIRVINDLDLLRITIKLFSTFDQMVLDAFNCLVVFDVFVLGWVNCHLLGADGEAFLVVLGVLDAD